MRPCEKALTNPRCLREESKDWGRVTAPSVEDKINRFADKDSHQIFVEPEGWKTVEIYVNGFSTSLPEEIQFEAIRLIQGLKKPKCLDRDMPLNMTTSRRHN